MSDANNMPAITQSKAKMRRRSILDAARRTIIQEGFSSFSLRRVAAMAEIGLSSLQHHYPSLAALTVAVVDDCIALYRRRLSANLAAYADNPRDAFRTTIECLLDDTRNPEKSILFPQLWSAASFHPALREAVDHFYIEYRQDVIPLIQDLNRALTPSQAEEYSLIINAVIEGACVVIATDERTKFDASSLTEKLIKMIETAS